MHLGEKATAITRNPLKSLMISNRHTPPLSYPPSILVLALVSVVTLPPRAGAQEMNKPHAVGVTVQAYPAGVILAARASLPIRARSTLTAHAAYNLTDRRDFGEHDNEEGRGPGFGLAFRRYLGALYEGVHLGARADLWFLEIDWEDDAPRRSGTTDIVVLQPTAQAGYTRTVANGRLVLEATVARGFEINIDTQGEAVGEGAILLGGLAMAYRL